MSIAFKFAGYQILSSISDLLIITLVVYNLHLSKIVILESDKRYDIAAGIISSGVYTTFLLHPVTGLMTFILIIFSLTLIPEKSLEKLISNSEEIKGGWYLSGGLFIGITTAFYAFVLSFVSLLSIGFALFNLLNDLRYYIKRRKDRTMVPTKKEVLFSKFHTETLILLIINIYALYWSGFYLNILLGGDGISSLLQIWQITSNLLLFITILVHNYYLISKISPRIDIRREKVTHRGVTASLVPLVIVFSIPVIVPDESFDGFMLEFTLVLCLLCVLWIATIIRPHTSSWIEHSNRSSIFLFCSMMWPTLTPEFSALKIWYVLCVLVISILISLHITSGYYEYPFNVLFISVLILIPLCLAFQPLCTVILFIMFGSNILFREATWLRFQQKYMQDQDEVEVLLVFAKFPESPIDRRSKSKVKALVRLVEQEVIEPIPKDSISKRERYRIRSVRWERRLSIMAEDKDWLEEIIEK